MKSVNQCLNGEFATGRSIGFRGQRSFFCVCLCCIHTAHDCIRSSGSLHTYCSRNNFAL